jgi:molecular chaperone DnaJ
MPDHYEVLGVPRNATPAEIKSAFRKLATQFHPDVSIEEKEEAERRFLRILEAYETLGDPEKRSVYDASGGGRIPSETGHFDIDDFSHVDELEDLFAGEVLETLFGRKGKWGPRKGGDLRFDVELTLEEALRGATREVMAPRTEPCPDCNGTGASPKGRVRPCPVCNGLGQVKGVGARGTSKYVTIDSCSRCRGTGRIADEECSRCAGRGKVRETKPVTVLIPAGAQDGSVLRLPSEGNEGLRGGPRGDLYLVVKVKPHGVFGRDGPDLKRTKEISYPMAALGGIAKVQTLDGMAELTVPPGTETGAVLRLRGLGMPGTEDGAGRGDLLVTIDVKTPTELTQKQRKLLEELAGPGDEKKRKRWWG